MKLRGLLELMFLLIVTSCAEDTGSWTVRVNKIIRAERGSNVTINCTFNCPSAHCNGSDVVQVYWKKNLGRDRTEEARDKCAHVYHENDEYVLPIYKGKTERLENKGNRDCSLKIKNVTDDDSRLYVRVITKSEQFSFYDKEVAIRVSDVNNSKTEDSQKDSAPKYMAICAPVAVLVIIIFILGIFCVIKNKRTKAITREESGYYANFSRASSNDAKSELSCKKIDTLPELKDIEEPVYANMKYPLDQSMDQTNNVYGNVDYSR